MQQIVCKTASKQDLRDFFLNNNHVVAKDGTTGQERAVITKEEDEDVWHVRFGQDSIENVDDLVQDSIDYNMILEAY